jgi:uncharacterized cupredoxin-like copper-binding protein
MLRTLLIAVAVSIAVPAAADEPKVAIAIHDNQFVPAEISVPAGVKVELKIKNEKKTAAEFESHELRREKVIAPGAAATLYVGPLKPGRYEFFDEFHPETRGFLVAK